MRVHIPAAPSVTFSDNPGQYVLPQNIDTIRTFDAHHIAPLEHAAMQERFSGEQWSEDD